MKTVQSLLPWNVQTWGILWYLLFGVLQGLFCLPAVRRLISPSLQPHKEGSERGDAHYHCSACQGLDTEGQQRCSCLDIVTLRLKQAGSSNGASLFAKTGFHRDFNPQASGDSSVLLALLTLPTGSRAGSYPCFILAQRKQGDEAISKEQGFSIASCLTVTSFGKMLSVPGAAEGDSSTAKGQALGVRWADTAPANRQSTQAALRQAAGADGDGAGAAVDLEPSAAQGQPDKAPLYQRLHRGTVLLVAALIAALPGEPGCFYLAVRAAAAAAGGLQGWGPQTGVQTSSGCEHNSQRRAFGKQEDAARPPWGTSKVCLALHRQKSLWRLMATCGPGPGIGSHKGKRV